MRSRRDKKRARERDRNKRSRKYGQIKRKHSRKGIWSCVMAVLVTAVWAGMVAISNVIEKRPVIGTGKEIQ